MRRKWAIWAGITLLVVAGTVTLWRFASPVQTVQVAKPVRRAVTELVIASGNLKANTLANVGSEVTGTVQDVFVDEGAHVRAGQTLITLERTDVEQQLQQARLAVDTAQRQLEVTRRGALPEEITRARAQLQQAQHEGKAKVAAAQQRLKQLQTGGRPEEIRRSQAQLAQATASRIVAQQDYQRNLALSSQGAIPASDLDHARAVYNQAAATENAARQALVLARRPARQEEINAARADLQAAQADYQGSVSVAQQNLDLLLRGPRIEDIRLAQSRLTEARAAVAYAQEQLLKRVITSPISGIVTTRDVDPGESVTAGKTLMTVTDMASSYIYVETDETNLPKLRVGEQAIVIPPSFPNQPFPARVYQIGPEVNTERGVVGVRLWPIALPAYAKPDMTADVNIEVAHVSSAWSVPSGALLTEGTRNYVLVVRNKRAIRRDVNVLARGAKYVGLSGIGPNDRVIVNATEISPGARVRVGGGG